MRDETDGRVDRVGTAEREIHVLQRSGRYLDELLGQLDGRLRAEMEIAGRVGQFLHLLGGGVDNALLAVTHIHAPQAGERVEQFVAGRVAQKRTAGRLEDGDAACLVRAVVDDRVNQMLAVGFDERLNRHVGFSSRKGAVDRSILLISDDRLLT
jgi:hypothetical protein